jgi:enamine deaminase RidA (YjgF/YER057c/UK114 family)
MDSIQSRLTAMGLVLPEATTPPPGVRLPFAPVRLHGTRALISGHGPVGPDGAIIGPLGKVGAEVTLEQAVHAARLTTLAMLGSLNRALGSLDRVTAWLRIFGMVNTAPDFNRYPAVLNGCSDLILELFGPAIGNHARAAVGQAGLPWDIPVEIEAEVEFA